MCFYVLFIIKPFLAVTTTNNRLIVVESPQELLQYFDEDQLFLSSYSDPNSSSSSIPKETNSANVSFTHDEEMNISIDDTDSVFFRESSTHNHQNNNHNEYGDSNHSYEGQNSRMTTADIPSHGIIR